jgi:putative membrane protein
MAQGFLGFPSTLMLDVVVCALVLVVPALLYSIYLVKFQRQYLWHRNLQIGLGIALLITVCLFEIDMRLQGGWQAILKNREHQLSAARLTLVGRILLIHVCFAVSAVLFWTVTLVHGLRNIPNPPGPSAHSKLHKRLGWMSTICLTLTSITGLIFYYYAFVG